MIKNLLVIATILFEVNQVSAAEIQQKSHEEIRKIMDSCFQSAGLTKPALGERPTAPTAEQIRQKDGHPRAQEWLRLRVS